MKMIHPDIEAIGDTTIEAFNANWAPRGWALLGEAEAFASEILGKPVKELDDLKVDELRALHSARGLQYPAGKVTKAELEKTFRGTFADLAPVDGAGEPVEVVETASTEEAAATAAAESGTPTPAASTKKKD